MLRQLAVSLFLSLALIGSAQTTKVGGSAKTKVGGSAKTKVSGIVSGGVTPAVGAVFSERFITGYTNAGWTGVNSTITLNAALPGSSGLTTTTSLDLTYAGGASPPYTYYNSNYGGAQRYIRFYLYIDSESLVDTDKTDIFTATETATDPTAGTDIAFALHLEQNAGALSLKAKVHDLSLSAGQTVTVATWYRVEIAYIANTVNGLTFRLYDSAGAQIGTDQQLTTSNWFFGYSIFGVGAKDNTDGFRIHYAAYDINSAGYVGP